MFEAHITNLVEYLQRESGRKIVPELIELGETTIFGTGHLLHTTDFPALTQRFDLKVHETNHLVLEASSTDRVQIVRNLPLSFEARALTNFPKRGNADRVHFLEDRANQREMALESGFGDIFYLALLYFYKIIDTFGDDVRWDLLGSKGNRMLELLKSSVEGYDNLSVSKLRAMVAPMVRSLSTSSRGADALKVALAESVAIRTWYFSMLRDFHYFAPQFRQLLGLDGPKLVIVGKKHMPILEKVYKGEAIERPPHWSEIEPLLPEPYKSYLFLTRGVVEGKIM